MFDLVGDSQLVNATVEEVSVGIAPDAKMQPTTRCFERFGVGLVEDQSTIDVNVVGTGAVTTRTVPVDFEMVPFAQIDLESGLHRRTRRLDIKRHQGILRIDR